MNKIAFGQYYHADSIIHRLDPRTKLISLILVLVMIFLIPKNNFIILGIAFILIIIIVILSKVPIIKFLKSLKQIAFLLFISFLFQVIFNKSGRELASIEQSLTIINLGIALSILVIYIFVRKYLKLKIVILLLITLLIIYLLKFPIYGNVLTTYKLTFYEDGILTGFFIIGRIFILLVFSSLLTLTTRPTVLNNGLEALLSPLEKIKIKTSIFSMMLSIALRFIPTLFIEADKILKAQAARGVDFTEGKLKDKIIQIVSLLVPMFVISFKRADDLANAMEARGYIPGAKRTKLDELKFHFNDYFFFLTAFMLLTIIIISRIYL